MSLAVRQTSGWQPFQIIRAVPQSTQLRLWFALAGVGTASIDGVMARTLDRPVIRRLPPVSSARNAAPDTANTAENAGPLLVSPGTR
jgi:hypothetical protein